VLPKLLSPSRLAFTAFWWHTRPSCRRHTPCPLPTLVTYPLAHPALLLLRPCLAALLHPRLHGNPSLSATAKLVSRPSRKSSACSSAATPNSVVASNTSPPWALSHLPLLVRMYFPARFSRTFTVPCSLTISWEIFFFELRWFLGHSMAPPLPLPRMRRYATLTLLCSAPHAQARHCHP